MLGCDAFRELKGLDLVGGYAFLRWSKGNSCYSRQIKTFNGKTLTWDDTDFYTVRTTGEDGRKGSPAAISKGKSGSEVGARFFLAGALDLLDAPGEWFAKDGTLYLYAPKGVKPDASDVLCKTSDYSIYETKSISELKIEGVDFFATSVKFENPANKSIKFRDCQFTYIGGSLLFYDIPTGVRESKPIDIEGTKCRFTSCLFAGAQNTALALGGSLNVVENCVFAENNRHANFQSTALLLRPKGAFKVNRNTFFNNCSDALRFQMDDDFDDSVKPQISYNNICNAGLFNRDVSGVYMPNLSQHWTEFHHNWVHNIHGNGVRLDQAGEKLSVHHNVFWASKRGLNIEGFGNFNVYNNTSVLNREACGMTRNVVDKRSGTGDAVVSNDTSFPPIDDWNVLNNLVTEFVDRVGPSEGGPFSESLKNGTLHPERPKQGNLEITDRGDVEGNLTGFKQSIFVNGSLNGLNLVPKSNIVEGGAAPTDKLKSEGVIDLGTYRGAYDVNDKGWPVGSNWMPFEIKVPKTMAQSEQFAKKFRHVSIVPQVNVTKLPSGQLSPDTFIKPVEKVLTKEEIRREKNLARRKAAKESGTAKKPGAAKSSEEPMTPEQAMKLKKRQEKRRAKRRQGG